MLDSRRWAKDPEKEARGPQSRLCLHKNSYAQVKGETELGMVGLFFFFLEPTLKISVLSTGVSNCTEVRDLLGNVQSGSDLLVVYRNSPASQQNTRVLFLSGFSVHQKRQKVQKVHLELGLANQERKVMLTSPLEVATTHSAWVVTTASHPVCVALKDCSWRWKVGGPCWWRNQRPEAFARSCAEPRVGWEPNIPLIIT